MARLFNDIQEEFIRKNIIGLGNQELADMVNNKFNMNITREQMKNWKSRRGLSSGLTGRYEKGHVPINKGTIGMFNVGGNKTSFKKGQKAHNYKPIGYTRINRDGYRIMKVQDDGPWQKRWKHEHKVIWEKDNGPIPKDHVLIFIDGDKENVELENLKLITKNKLLVLNRNGWKFKDKNLIETGLLLADINIEMNKKRDR